MIIRASNENDITRIFQIEKSVFLESAWFRKMIVNELLKKSDRYTWIIENEKELIGYCMIRFGPGEVHLINMAIAPSFQQKGLGRKLLQYFLNNIPKDSSVFLEVKRGNLPGINLYLDAGFEDIAIREKYYENGEDAIVMHLKIS
ncbi:MAG: ribosomal protein S18-alanine N-acetyltransferase [Candidatus Marinimicrobia bacterium]|jgi:ribosomal-protein-alanine N-acetyltransferase|nr:ribosomal protein S18-alanine N-acetyltransferase [Candidatus Neomarinimicrobiota bacterium]MBT3502400.1 ribosomal protein S18-alanine N-acetyltransferase [Candidatus Neomarinimicrobiota bacterium]MBT3839331.1 ribosomal protein S18-alanine N-acetyltransferase [Candidatus Neomarinimicrobiota bacterium]MBT3998669.1 ribosomal protein S18-alanine N-acetyltransferase [Candidatus Neomarinimicrobiota bacterium]MBT4283237.1 ribosomal protein S18-alanine N-acetyltransferase [Candidatus Neomarinimicro